MTTSQEDFKLRLKECFKSMLWLVVVAILLFGAISLFAFPQFGSMGLMAASVSGAVCLASAIAALFVTGLWVGTPNAINGVCLGMLLRTGVPFLLAILLSQTNRPLADAGLFAMVLVNFLVMLAVETLLVVRIVQTDTSTA